MAMPLRWKRMSTFLLAVILLPSISAFAISCSSSGPRKPEPVPIGDYTYVKTLAEQRLEQVMKRHHVPGMTAVLINDQEIIWQGNYGWANIEQEIPVTEDTVFKMLSLAKPFTAVETMRLVEEGLVDLDAPITDYLSDFTIWSRFPDGEPITIRHILTHRSGLPRNGCVKPDWYFGPEAVEYLTVTLSNCFLTYPTGERYKYSNIGFDSLGTIIQEKRAQAFPVYMHENLLAPVGMSASSFWPSGLGGVGRLDDAQKASGYEFFEGEYYAREQYDIAAIPSGNLYATANDLAAFVKFIFRGGEADGAHLISSETLALMFEEQASRVQDPQRMGLGWKIGRVLDTEKMVWHDGGSSEGIGSLIAFLPERKLGVILLGNGTNFEGVLSAPLAVELLEAMLETEYGLVKEEQKPPDSYPMSNNSLAAYQGDYALMGQIMAVVLDGDKLRGSIAGMSFDLIPVGENRFRASHWLYNLGLSSLLPLPMDLTELEIEFQPGAEPAGDLMIVDFGGITYETAPRYPAIQEIPESWAALAGKYERYDRLQSGEVGPEKLGEMEIVIEDSRLFMSGSIGPVLPIDDSTIIILSGSFGGETVGRDPQTGFLYHQGNVYKPELVVGGK